MDTPEKYRALVREIAESIPPDVGGWIHCLPVISIIVQRLAEGGLSEITIRNTLVYRKAELLELTAPYPNPVLLSNGSHDVARCKCPSCVSYRSTIAKATSHLPPYFDPEQGGL